MNFNSLKKIFKYLKPYSAIQMAIITITVGATFIEMVDPLIYKMLIDEVFIGKNINVFFIVAILYIGKTFLSQIFYLSKDYLGVYLGSFVALDIRKNIFRKIANSKFLEKKFDSGSILVTFNGDVTTIENIISQRIFFIIFSLFKLTGVAIFTLILSWEYFLCFLIVIPLRFINNALWMGKVMQRYNEIREAEGNAFGFFYEGIKNSRYVKLSGKEKYIERKFFKKNKEMVIRIFKSMRVSWAMNMIEITLQYLDKLIMIGVGGLLFYFDRISIGTYLALITYETVFKGCLIDVIMGIQNDIGPLLVAIDRVEKIYEMEQEDNKGESVKKINGDIEFKNVKFYYDEGDKIIFDKFNLKINAGEKIAIVGESGSGKSTLINLILGLIKPIEGSIEVDNKNYEDLNLKFYRKRFGLVAQENFFFKDTMKENLTLGDKLDEKEIKRAIKIAQADEIIKSNLKGIEGEIEQGGKNFSGGEKQRLSIARMLLRKPDVVILDEASSALDNITEEKLQIALDEELKNKTVITIAHRLSTIKNADRIIVMKDGKILEEGNHQVLMNINGEYCNMIRRKESLEE